MTTDYRARGVWVYVGDRIADDIRTVAAHVSSHPLPDALERPLTSVAALIGLVSEAQAMRDAREQREAERSDYR